MLEELLKDIEDSKNLQRAKISQKFFKTAPNEYGAGDVFLGITVPESRKIANKYTLELPEILQLLKSEFHETRLIGLLILINLYDSNKEERCISFYLDNTEYINNWDLVDLSCYKLLGDYLVNFKNSDYEILKNLSKSNNIWERRISIVTTIIFIRNNYLEPTLIISKILLKDNHDLIRKAIGWMLREVGKKDKKVLDNFLEDNIKNISSITLNYAMEKFDKNEKEHFRGLRK